MTDLQAFEMLGKEVAEIAMAAIKKEFIDQGHNMTGSLLNSIKYDIKAEASKVLITFSLYDYGMIQNYGVTKEQIITPFAKARIAGLKRFVEIRMGYRGKDAEAVAFAIARKHKDEGMPTKASVKYSKTGSRVNWITHGLKVANPKIIETIDRVFTEIINVIVIKGFVDINKKNSENLKITIK